VSGDPLIGAFRDPLVLAVVLVGTATGVLLGIALALADRRLRRAYGCKVEWNGADD
jgi:hypothetical protein